MTTVDTQSHNLYDFQHPNIVLRLALGHKYHAWYLVFARAYGMAESREVSRLDKPGLRSPTPGSGRPRFWFDPKAVSGWERNGENLLNFLLSLSPEFPPVLEVVSTKSLLNNKGGAKVVEVLVPEHRLAHWCESCRSWETVSDNHARWILVRRDTLPGYICRVCRQKDWFGLQILRVISSFLHKIF